MSSIPPSPKPQKLSTLSISLYKSKILSTDNPPSSFTLSFTLYSTIQKTEKISSKEHTFTSNKMTFKYSPKNLTTPSLEINAEISSWVLFNSTIAKLSIPLTPLSLNDQKQWFYLKNENDENVISILLSMATDYNDHLFYKKKSELSYTVQVHNNIVNSILNRTLTQPDTTSSKTNKHTSYDSGVYRVNQTHNNPIEVNILDYIQKRLKLLIEKEENLQFEKIKSNDFSLNLSEKNERLIKEREKLNNQKKQFNIKKKEYNKKVTLLNHFVLESELNAFDKEIFLNLNFVYLMSNKPNTNNNNNNNSNSLNMNNMICKQNNKSCYLNNNINIIKEINCYNEIKKDTVVIKENPLNYQINKKIIPKAENALKKSVGSTNAASNHSSEISLSEITNINSNSKFPQVKQIYLNTTINEPQKEGDILIDSLETLPKQYTRRKVANANISNNDINFQRNAISQKKQNIKIIRGDINNKNTKRKIKKKCVISLNSHKSINTSLYSKNKIPKMSYSYYINSHGNFLNSTFTQTSNSMAQTTRNSVNGLPENKKSD